MKPPTDKQEEDRARSLTEQCWLGPLCLVFWSIVIVAVFYGCSAKGGEVTLAWDANQPTEQVTGYRLYLGLDLLAEVAAPATQATVTLPDGPCEVSIVAVNAAGTSPPASLKVAYIVDQDTVDLRAWRTLRGYYREFLPGTRFYRTRIETPP